LDPLHGGVISFGGMQAGNSYNIIPDKVKLQGTVWALTYEGAELMHKKTAQLTESICKSFGAKGHYHFIEGTPQLYNHSEACEFAKEIIQKTLGEDVFLPYAPVLGAEDYAYYN
jgi:metal-dependent amidase/aminoacylase/carboxypeptidase family protein